MNDKEILKEKDAEHLQTERASHRKVYGAIIAAAICILLALVVWIGVMNSQDTDFIPVRVEGPEGYTYELSVDGVEVEGKVSDLRQLDEIVVKFNFEDLESYGYHDPDGDGKGNVNEAFLGLPDSITVTREFVAELTIKAK